MKDKVFSYLFTGSIWWKLLSSAVVTVGVLTALHYGTRLYIGAETAAGNYAVGTAHAFVIEKAAEYGFEKKQPPAPPLPELTPIEIAEREAMRRNLNPRLVIANMAEESSFDPNALSVKGAIGHMQVMAFNYKRCKLKSAAQLLNVEDNIKCGTQIMAEDIAAEGDDADRGLQRYNGGPKCVNVCAESINHARKVMKRFIHDIG